MSEASHFLKVLGILSASYSNDTLCILDSSLLYLLLYACVQTLIVRLSILTTNFLDNFIIPT